MAFNPTSTETTPTPISMPRIVPPRPLVKAFAWVARRAKSVSSMRFTGPSKSATTMAFVQSPLNHRRGRIDPRRKITGDTALSSSRMTSRLSSARMTLLTTTIIVTRVKKPRKSCMRGPACCKAHRLTMPPSSWSPRFQASPMGCPSEARMAPAAAPERAMPFSMRKPLAAAAPTPISQFSSASRACA